MKIDIVVYRVAAAVALFSAPVLAATAAEEGSHRHHVAVAAGAAAHNSETSAYLGVDYVYRFSGPWAVGVFYEEVSGDFDLRALGVSVGRYFDSGWKLAGGIGAEYKIKKDKTLALVHLTAGYDWHIGNWSVGPTATVDFIENGEQTYYLGVSVGYGF